MPKGRLASLATPPASPVNPPGPLFSSLPKLILSSLSFSNSAVSSDAETFAVTLSSQTNSNNATIIAQSHSSSETTFDVTADCDNLFPEGSNYVLSQSPFSPLPSLCQRG